ncbi:MAG: fumarylacetoacetase [Fimbriimonadaceae bacterium]|nr:fumarylacetoacetase [Fimbriimonadaceae bacterium]
MKPFVVPATAKSWVDVAANSDFPIQNLPFGLAAPKGRDETMVVAIGDYALDLLILLDNGLIPESEFPLLESFIDMDREKLSALRQWVFGLLTVDDPRLRDNKTVWKKALIPIADANLQVPIPPVAFVDFYSGVHHARNVGQMFRPQGDPLLPNYKWIPIGYNGRANTVVVSGTEIIRPRVQTKAPDVEEPAWGPSRELDFELEMGYYIGTGSEMGRRVTVTKAEEHMLGLVLVNDWSARDGQRWEYQPLGPFLAKSFATTISPWIVTLDALAPFRIEGMDQDPTPLPHLTRTPNSHFDIELRVSLQSAKMKKPQTIAKSNMKHLYWSIAQQVAHQTSNGTPLDMGDLYATGTISGEGQDEAGSMLELSWKGDRPIKLDETGESRTFLEDGDTVILEGWGQGDGFRVGFGQASGKVKSVTK